MLVEPAVEFHRIAFMDDNGLAFLYRLFYGFRRDDLVALHAVSEESCLFRYGVKVMNTELNTI